MGYVISDESVDAILYFFRLFFVNLGAYYVFLRLINKNNFKIGNLITALIIILITSVCTIVKVSSNLMNCMILLVILLTITFYKTTKNPIGYSIVATVLALSISNIIFFISVLLNGLPNIIFKIQNDYIAFLFIISIYFLLMYLIMKIKRLKNGFSFLNKKAQSEFFDVLIINLSAIILFCMAVLGNYDILIADKMGFCIIIFSIVMFITVKKSFQIYYKQRLLIKEMEETKSELATKETEIEKLEQENLEFSKRSHSLAHKQRALEFKLNQLMLKTELAEELTIKDEIDNVSKELYHNITNVELAKTDITEIDDMLKFVQSECVKNNIEFNLQINGNIYYMINNLISKEELEILIADHVKDAIIAIKHTDNMNKSILVRIGKIEECYGLYIYDSGIEFEKETLKNLGKKPSTTHADEGGTGIGFMNTFETLRKHNASLIIKELGKPSKENYTKIIMIKFDNRNEFKIDSYRNET